jgi:glycosyltransferase involved in cell wall biosynthesis
MVCGVFTINPFSSSGGGRGAFPDWWNPPDIGAAVFQTHYAMDLNDLGTFFFVEFADRLPPRHLMFKRWLDMNQCQVVCLFWDRETEGHTDPRPFRIHVPGDIGKISLLLKMPAVWRQYLVTLRKLKAANLVIGHIGLLPLALIYRVLNGWRKTTIWYDAMDNYPLSLALKLKPLHPYLRPLFELIEGIMTVGVTGVTTIDSVGERMYRRLAFWNRPTLVLWNVPSLNDAPDREAAQAVHRLCRGRRVVVYIGGIRKKKGILNILAAAARVIEDFPDALFLLIGPLSERSLDLEAAIRRLGIEKHVVITGYLPYRKMLAYLAHAHVALAPYQDDPYYREQGPGTARKVFTYMRAALPVIVPAFGRLGRVVDEEECGLLVDTGNTEAMVTAINALLNDPKKAQALGRNGRRAVERRYNWEAESKPLAAFLATHFISDARPARYRQDGMAA